MNRSSESNVTSTIHNLISSFPPWHGEHDLRITSIGEHNFTNLNFRVESRGEIFKVRISEGNQRLIGTNPEEEVLILKAVAQMGIGAEVIAFIPPKGHLVMRFIEGSHFTSEEIRMPCNIRLIANVLKQVHGIHGFETSHSPFERIEDLLQNARLSNSVFPSDFGELLLTINTIQAALSSIHRESCLCHNDLASSNILKSNGSIYLIDWEYAGEADPMFDLASFSMNQALDDLGDRILIQSYFGTVTDVHIAEINLWKVVARFLEGVWGILQTSISGFDRDYQEFANENFSAVRQDIKSNQFKDWLSIVSIEPA